MLGSPEITSRSYTRRPSLVARCLSIAVVVSALSGVLAAPTSAVNNRPLEATAVQPSRILDTRVGLGAPQQQLSAGATLTLAIPAGAPPGATSIVMNVTATNATANGYVKIWPCGEMMPATSALNYAPGRTSANAVVLKATQTGMCFTSNAEIDLIADLTGWYTGTSDFVGSTPVRLLDSRSAKNPLQPGEERQLKVAGQPGIDGGAKMAGLNLTVENAAVAGWVVAYPCGQPSDGSTVNFGAGETVANFTFVALTTGTVCLKSNVVAPIIVDSYGWSAATGRFVVQSPTRLLDTRDQAQWPNGKVQSDSSVQLRVAGRAGVPNDAAAAVLTITVAQPAGDGYVTVWGCDQQAPLASTVNTFPNALRSNLTIVNLSTIGSACLRYKSSNDTPTHLVVDAIGWTTGGPRRSAPTGVGSTILPGATSCVFSSAVSVAFCDSFDAPTPNALTRSGDLDASIWGVSRTNTLTNTSQGENNLWKTATLSGCGPDQQVTPPNDVKICNGRVVEAVSDGSGQSVLAMYPKQPFDIAGRTGTAVFDVSADSAGAHNAWPEFWYTDQPVPAPLGGLAAQAPYAANSFGFDIAGCDGNQTGVNHMMMTRNHQVVQIPFTQVGCITKGSLTGGLNHFEVRINANRAEVWASEPGSTTIKLIAYTDTAMPLTRGVIWIEDVHYNACKEGFGTPQCNHSFAWDNVGFDGPTPYRDLTFDVQDARTPGNGGVNLGYFVDTKPIAVTAPAVHWDQTPTKQFVTLNWFAEDPNVPSVRINGGAWQTIAWPFDSQTYVWRTIAIPINFADVHTGNNTIELKHPTTTGTVISNINLTLIAATNVP